MLSPWLITIALESSGMESYLTSVICSLLNSVNMACRNLGPVNAQLEVASSDRNRSLDASSRESSSVIMVAQSCLIECVVREALHSRSY